MKMARGRIKTMRKGIDFIGVGVGAAMFKNGKIFLARRGPKARNEKGTWEIPGGSVEFGETFEQALKREIKEELGIEIELGELLGVCDHIIINEKQHWVSPTYFCKVKRGTPKIMEPEKCDKIGWFSIKETEKLSISLITQHDIRTLKKKFPKGLPKNL